MPGHYRLWFNNDQGLGPAGPQVAERSPEQSIERAQFGTGLLSLEHGELLPKGDRFQSEIVTRHEKGAEAGDQRQKERNHQSMLVEGRLQAQSFCVANA